MLGTGTRRNSINVEVRDDGRTKTPHLEIPDGMIGSGVIILVRQRFQISHLSPQNW